jgi:hypothetical protein
VAVIGLGAVAGVLFWKRRNQSMVAENNAKSRDTFPGDQTALPNLGQDDGGAVRTGKPALEVFQSSTIDMQDTVVADDVHVLEKSGVQVSFSFCFVILLFNGHKIRFIFCITLTNFEF